jgi:uncharacterized LabA/DUF88 family protein
VPDSSPPKEASPSLKAIAFVDGQNLYYAAWEAFGYDYPNYHPLALADRICADRKWESKQLRFYTGVPKRTDNLYWHNFWAAKKRFLSRDKRVYVFTRDTHYREKCISFEEDEGRILLTDGSRVPKGTQLLLPSGKTHVGEFWVRAGEEKGIDVRIALDLIRLAHHKEFDVAIIFSQDQDLSEAVSEIKEIAREQGRFVHLYCAFPRSGKTTNAEPIRGTNALEITRELYDACLDPSNYRR